MPDDVKIQITTPADLTGAKQTDEALKAATAQAEKLDTALTDAAEAQRRLVNEYRAPNDAANAFAGPAPFDPAKVKGDAESAKAARSASFLADWAGKQKEVVNTTKEQTAAQEALNLKNAEFRASLKALAAAFPELSPLMGFLSNPATFGIGAATIGIGLLTKEIIEANRAMKEFLDVGPNFDRFRGQWHGIRDATREARIETRAFINEVEDSIAAEKTLQEALKDSVKAIDDKFGAQTKLAGLQSGLYQAELEDLKRRGVITEAQEKVYAALIAQQETLNRLRAEGAVEAAKLAEQEASLVKLNQQLDANEQKLPLAAQNLAAEQQKLDNLKADKAKADEKLNPSGQAEQEFQKKLEDYQKLIAPKGIFSDGTDYSYLGGLTEKERADYQAQLQSFVKNPAANAGAFGADFTPDAAQGELAKISQFNAASGEYRRLLAGRAEAIDQRNKLPDQIESQAALVNEMKTSFADLKKEVSAAAASIRELNQSLDSGRADLRNNDIARNRELAIAQRRTQITVQENGGIPGRQIQPRTPQEFYQRDVESLSGGAIARQAAEVRRATTGRDNEILGVLRDIAQNNASFAREIVALRTQLNNNRQGRY